MAYRVIARRRKSRTGVYDNEGREADFFFPLILWETSLYDQNTGSGQMYEVWDFNSGNYLFTTDTKHTCFEVLLSFTVVTSIVYNPLPAMWKS